MKKSMLSKVQAYLAHRRALGFQLKSEGVRLLDFARYADARGHRDPLTNQLAVKWACLPKAADRLWWARRLEIVRTFGSRSRTPKSRHGIGWGRPTVAAPRTSIPASKFRNCCIAPAS